MNTDGDYLSISSNLQLAESKEQRNTHQQKGFLFRRPVQAVAWCLAVPISRIVE
ncbi:hypothetical protein O9929_26175 [Vibrio lentus]|nr:hypothetical protein [Vibrio lentus]